MRFSIIASVALALAICGVSPSTARHSIASHHNHVRALVPRDAYNQLEGDNNQDGGPKSGPLNVPRGSRLRNITVGAQGEELVTYWSNAVKDANAQMAIVMIHGRARDGDNYWSTANAALQSALNDNVKGAERNTIVIAPQFMSTIRNRGQYRSNQIAFADVNAWQVGERATQPRNTGVSSFSAIDGLLSRLSNKKDFPNLKRVVLVGHGGGGQMMSRYAVLGSVPSSSVFTTRFVIGDPSSNLYFTANRPLSSSFNARGFSKDNCPLYNTYRYGFDKLRDSVTTLASDRRSPQDFFARFAKRDVHFLVAEADTDANGDQTCMGILLGGQARRDRNLMYWRYINALAGTGRSMSGIPGQFASSLPNWSSVTGGKLNAQLTRIPDASHDAAAVFGSSRGRDALFA